MKKTFLFLFAAFTAASMNAQLVVEESGKTAVGYDGTSAIASDFAVNSVGNSSSTMYVQSNKWHGLYINQESASNNNSPNYGIYNVTKLHSTNPYATFGIYSTSYYPSSSVLTIGTAVGVYGSAGHAQTGYNFGVYGELMDTYVNGAGIYGSNGVNSGYFSGVTGRYAGYFKGDVYSTGTITGTLANSSDYRLKENIQGLRNSSLEGINRMNVVEFNYKQREVGADEKGNILYLYEDDSPVLTHKHYGLIAQELQDIYPDLVYEGTDGYLSVIYTEIVPLLIHAIQELSARLDEVEEQKSINRREDEITGVKEMDFSETQLLQNNPNPFTENTVVSCTIAEEVKKAMLYIYDLNGEQLQEYSIEGRGETSIIIEGSSLKAGMYLYSLIADSKIIDTKRMILTK